MDNYSRGLITAWEIQKYVAACCRRVGIKVQFEHGCTPGFSGSTLKLPTPLKSWTDAQFNDMKFFVKHETCHVQYTDMREYVKQAGKDGSLLASVVNMLEDFRIDNKNDAMYEGDKALTQASYASMLEKLKKAKLPDAVRDFIMPLYSWLSERSLYQNRLDLAADFAGLSSPNGLDVLKNLRANAGLTNELLDLLVIEDNRDAVAAVGALARKIINDEMHQDTEPMEQEPTAGGDGEDDEDGKSGEGKGKSSGKSQGKKSGKGKDGEPAAGQEPQDSPGEEGGDKKIIEIPDGSTLTGLPMKHPNTSNTGIQSLSELPKGNHYSDYKPDEESAIIVDDLTKPHTLKAGRYDNDIKSTVDQQQNFANLVRTQLQIVSRDRFEANKIRGRLNKSVLYRAAIPDGGRHSEALFKKRIANDTLDTCISVLVDCSGSMGGTKFTIASAAAVLLSESLGNTLGLPIEILGFTTAGSHSPPHVETHRVFVFRKFDQKIVPASTMVSGFSAAGNYLANNVDGESIMFGYRRLKRRREKRKIMIVLSDGQPAGGHDKGEIISYTKDVVKAIQNDKDVEIVGIGILYSSVKELYKDYAVVKTVTDLPSVLLSTVKRKVLSK